MKINNLLFKLNYLTSEDINKIYSAYLFAEQIHHGQYRSSGEEYITHPLNVALKLSYLKADADTICAGLLHDTIEDGNISYDDIKCHFGETIAELVNGVTKMQQFKFSSKEEQNFANTRKIITSVKDDPRIIIIKLCDRLHNMETLNFKSNEKQIENSFETLHIFAPMAGLIGAHEIKNELEDLSLKYLKPDDYKRLSNYRCELEFKYEDLFKEVINKISFILSTNNIPNEVKSKIKSIYSIYKRELYNKKDIKDLLTIKVIVDNVLDCYNSLDLIHNIYIPLNGSISDFISISKPNQYRSLHSILNVNDNCFIQSQIRTKDMDKIDEKGLCAYWDLYGSNASIKMKDDLYDKYSFYKIIDSLDKEYENDEDFVYHVELELLSDNIIFYGSNGKVYEIPYGTSIRNYLLHNGIKESDVDHILLNHIKVNSDTIINNGDILRLKLKN